MVTAILQRISSASLSTLAVLSPHGRMPRDKPLRFVTECFGNGNLWDTRRRVQFVTQMAALDSSMLEVIRKLDPTFELKEGQRYTAVNSNGFEIDIIRHEVTHGDPNSDPHPLPLPESEEEFWAVQPPRAGLLLDGPCFSSMVVSVSGQMARMTTIAPSLFASFKRWMAERPDRAPLKRSRDQLQAGMVEKFRKEYPVLFVSR